MVPFEKALVTFYRLSIVTFPLSYVSEMRYCRFCSPACHFFPTQPPVSSKFPHVPLEVGGYKSEGVGLIVREISFQDFQPM